MHDCPESIEGDACPECGGDLQGGEPFTADEIGEGDGHADEPVFIEYGCENPDCGAFIQQKLEPVGARVVAGGEA